MRKPKFVERFREVVEEVKDEGIEYEPVCDNRVKKEAYICKRLKMTRSKLYETCLATGIDVMYEALMDKSGARR